MAGWLLAALCVSGWTWLPKSGGHLEIIRDHVRLSGHLLGVLPRRRVVQYGKISPPAPRDSNGSITEVQGWVDKQVFRDHYLRKEPVVFRGAAMRQNGFNLECLTARGPFLEVVESELTNKLIRIFRDEYDDASAEWMTVSEYRHRVAEAQANASLGMPYARAFPLGIFKSCKDAVDPLGEYHSPEASLLAKAAHATSTAMVFLSLSAGTTTKMHMDVSDSFFTQVYGRKRWLFTEARYAAQLQVYADTMNLVYIAGYDVHREPVPPEITMREVTLEPGDVLYFPSMSFHAVYNLDPITMGIDEVAPDPIGALKRHWFFAAGTLLNPWVTYKTLSQVWRTGAFDGHELFFEGFSAKSRPKEGEEKEL